ncbi:MAG: RNA polymerase sigma factor [Planctomycetota bacterium]
MNDDSTDTKQDANSIEGLFARNLPMLVAYLRARVGRALAERESVHDLAQSVCREVLTDRAQLEFDNDESFRAYLFLQASRKIIDRSRYHRAAMRNAGQANQSLEDNDSSGLLATCMQLVTPSRAAASREQLSRVEAAIQELPERQSEAVMLSRIAGISYAEIARQMQSTEASVRGLTARGLATLAARLGGS